MTTRGATDCTRTGRTHRLYFALWPDVALRSAIELAARPAVDGAERIVPPSELHVTLAFLGAVPEARVAAVLEAGRRVDCGGGVQRFDRFARWSAGGPVVAEPTTPVEALGLLHDALHSSLSAADFALAGREFRPHITLSRGPARRTSAVARNPLPPGPVPAIDWPFASFALVESLPTDRPVPPGGGVGPTPESRYAVLATFALRAS